MPPRHSTLLIMGGVAAGLALAGSVATAQPPGLAMVSSVGDTDFGSLQVGQTKSVEFTLSSTAATPPIDLTRAPVPTGTDAGDFTITPGTCAAAFGLTTTSTCTSTVTFAPKSAGAKSATVVASGTVLKVSATSTTGVCTDPNVGTSSPYECEVTFKVTGTATAAATPTVGTTLTPARRTIRARKTAKVTLTASNPGTTALSNVVTSMPLPAGFIAINRGGGTVASRTISWTASSLAAGASATYTVTLRPIGNRARKAAITSTVSATGATSVKASGTIIVVPVKRREIVPVVG